MANQQRAASSPRKKFECSILYCHRIASVERGAFPREAPFGCVCERLSKKNGYPRKVPESTRFQSECRFSDDLRKTLANFGFKMFYTPDILCMRKKGKLARVWLAATLNERLFKQAVSKKALLAIDIDTTCNEILKVVVSGGQFGSSRFSLYLSSQLMYGMCKLLSYQATMFEASLITIQHQLMPVVFPPKKKQNKLLSEHIFEIDLPEVPDLKKTFKNLHVRADVHLLPEADFELSENWRARPHVHSPEFGELTDEQVTCFLLEEDDWQLQTHEGLDITELDEHNANQRTVSPPPLIEQPDFAATDGFRNTADTVAIETLGSVLKTPKKRESRLPNVDTPTKRRRRNLELDMNGADEQRSEAPEAIQPIEQNEENLLDIQPEIPDDGFVPLPNDEPSAIPIDTAIQPTNRPEDTTALEDNALHLDALESDVVVMPKRKRHRRIFIDERTTLGQAELAKLIGNPMAHTIPNEDFRIRSVREQFVPATLLLSLPSTCHRSISRDYLRNGPRYSKWALKLRPAFDLRIIGPFRSEVNESISVEAILAANSREQNIAEEILCGLARAIEDEPTRNKTDEGAKLVESMHPQGISGIPEEDDHLPDVNVDHTEPIFENTGEMGNDENIPEELESNVVPIDQADNNKVQDANEILKDTPTATKISDPETADLDAFLPSHMRTHEIVTETSYEKRSTPEAIVEIPDSPGSSRSKGSSAFQSNWTYQELQALIAVYWEECGDERALKLSDLVPPESASREDAVGCFTLLMELHKNKLVNLAQEEAFSPIYIYKPAG